VVERALHIRKIRPLSPDELPPRAFEESLNIFLLAATASGLTGIAASFFNNYANGNGNFNDGVGGGGYFIDEGELVCAEAIADKAGNCIEWVGSKREPATRGSGTS